MQHRRVRLIAAQRQGGPFRRRGVGQQRQRHVRMGGKHHLVERLPLGPPDADMDAAVLPPHARHRGGQPQVDAFGDQGGLQAADVLDRAALDGEPVVLLGHLQQRVVLEEAQYRIGGEIEDPLLGRRPDRPRQRQQVIVAEPRTGADRRQQVADGHAGADGRQGARVEAEDVAQQAQERRAGKVRPLGKGAVQRFQPVFQPAAPDRGGKAHVAGGHRHVQPREQIQQVRIVHPVEHDEPGIDRLIPPLARQHGAGVTAKPTLRLVQHHGMIARQQLCCRHPRDAAADDGHAAGTGPRSFKGHLGRLSCARRCFAWTS